MIRLPLAILLVAALALAGCTAPDESGDNDGGPSGNGGGQEVSGTMEVVESNETNTTATENSTNTTTEG